MRGLTVKKAKAPTKILYKVHKGGGMGKITNPSFMCAITSSQSYNEQSWWQHHAGGDRQFGIGVVADVSKGRWFELNFR